MVHCIHAVRVQTIPRRICSSVETLFGQGHSFMQWSMLQVHRIVQLSVMGVAIIAFIIIFVDVGGYSQVGTTICGSEHSIFVRKLVYFDMPYPFVLRIELR